MIERETQCLQLAQAVLAFSHSLGPKPPIEDVRASVAIRGKPDVLCSA
jgi:hypothetical protein